MRGAARGPRKARLARGITRDRRRLWADRGVSTLRATEIERHDERTLEVRLDGHHLPLLYTLEARFDEVPFEAEVRGLRSRIAFITRATGTPDLGGWTKIPTTRVRPRGTRRARHGEGAAMGLD